MAYRKLGINSTIFYRWNFRKANVQLCLSAYRRSIAKSANAVTFGITKRLLCCSSNPLQAKTQKPQDGDGKIEPTIKSFTSNEDRKVLEIEWEHELNIQKNIYPFVWLRDNCQCMQCFHHASNSRVILLSDLKLEDTPTDVKIENHSSLKIKWSDGHESLFSSQWLEERAFGKVSTKRKSLYKLDRKLWGSEIIKNLPMANFGELLANDLALLTWLQQLEVFGFVLISNAPAVHGQLRRLTERVAFIKSTHYGAEFAVKAKSNPSNVAYSSDPLQLHTDLPYYEYKPGIQMIHCLVQYDGEGAESLIADAVHVAKLLKGQFPDMYEILTTVLVDWYDIGNDEGREFYKLLQRPVISLDAEGEISRINFSQPQRDSFFNVEVDVVPKWYEALKVFDEMLHDPNNCIQFKMGPGTIQSFDNLRVLHGRTKSLGEDLGNRELEGCYMDWDEARSKRRVLEGKFSLNSEYWCQKALNS